MTTRFVQRAAGRAAFGAMLVGMDARALDGDVTADSVAQFYDVTSPTGQVLLERRRLTATLGLGAYDLLGTAEGDPHAADLSIRMRVRYDADYGAPSATSDPTIFGSIVPGFAPQAVDLMYFYLEGRRFGGGWLGFKLGRQYVTDVLGWWSFDGGEVSVTTPYYLKAEAYGGLEQRGGMPLSTSRFEADGVWRGDRTGFEPLLYPEFQPAEVAPALGVALESVGLTWIHGRLTYRRVYDTGPSTVSEFPDGSNPGVYDRTRISSERLGYAVDANLAAIGAVKAGIVYDFYRAEITSAYASLDGYLGKRLTVSTDYDYYLPTFDGDSIWNFFAGEPRGDLGLRANVDIDRRLSVAGNALARVSTVQTAPFDPGGGFVSSPSPNSAGGYYPTNGHPFDEGGNVSARWHSGETRIAAHASGDFGSEGDRVGGDVSAEQVIETRYMVGGRAGLWQWKDDLRPDRAATGFQYVANVGYRFDPRCRGSFEWEHDFNGLVGQRFRFMFLLSLDMGKLPQRTRETAQQ